jgi:hypothetical protein
MRFAVLLVAALAFPATAEDLPLGSVRIVDAVYGVLPTRQLCDATAVIAAICEGANPCAFLTSNALCGDPAPNVPKRLFLAFKCGVLPVQTLIAPEPSQVRLACPKDSFPGKPT